jgi:hypothetical protein
MKSSLAFLSTLLMAGLLCGCSEIRFERRYNYYFPRGDELRGDIRQHFDAILLTHNIASLPPNERVLYDAFHGDKTAIHRFFNDPALLDGKPGWPGRMARFGCTLLLCRMGDDDFAKALSRESSDVREAVGYALDPMIEFDPFPKTRAQYTYRWAGGP